MPVEEEKEEKERQHVALGSTFAFLSGIFSRNSKHRKSEQK